MKMRSRINCRRCCEISLNLRSLYFNVTIFDNLFMIESWSLHVFRCQQTIYLHYQWLQIITLLSVAILASVLPDFLVSSYLAITLFRYTSILTSQVNNYESSNITMSNKYVWITVIYSWICKLYLQIRPFYFDVWY